MSSKTQLNGYIKRLKKDANAMENEMKSLTKALKEANNKVIELSYELSQIKISWFRRMLNRLSK